MATKAKSKAPKAKPQAQGEFWTVIQRLKASTGACEDADDFLVKRRPKTLDEAWGFLVEGVKRAAAKGRNESAYATAMFEWTGWLANNLKSDSGNPLYKFTAKNCEHCGADIDYDATPVQFIMAYLAKNPGPPFTEKAIREKVASIDPDGADEFSEEDEELAKAKA